MFISDGIRVPPAFVHIPFNDEASRRTLIELINDLGLCEGSVQFLPPTETGNGFFIGVPVEIKPIYFLRSIGGSEGASPDAAVKQILTRIHHECVRGGQPLYVSSEGTQFTVSGDLAAGLTFKKEAVSSSPGLAAPAEQPTLPDAATVRRGLPVPACAG